MSARELFLNRKDVRREVVKLDLGEGVAIDVEVRAVSLAAGERIAKANEKSPTEGVVQLLVEALSDPSDGSPLFKAADAARLKELTQPQIAPLLDAFARVSTLPKQADAGKGSAATPAA